MPSVDTVKRALRALATRTDTARPPCVAIVNEAHAALDDVERAAGFVDAVGLDRLDDAVERARDVGEIAAAERGADAMDAYRALRRAASGEGRTAERTAHSSTEREDHFHSARGTDKRRASQGPVE